MISFQLRAIGHLARNPENVTRGEVTHTRFCLIGHDYIGNDEEGAGRETVTAVWFVAYGPIGESVQRHARKGDQLIVEARLAMNTWTDKQGEKQYDNEHVVTGFRFGAPGKVTREKGATPPSSNDPSSNNAT